MFAVKNYLDTQVMLIDIHDKYNPKILKSFRNYLNTLDFESINTNLLTYNRKWLANVIKGMHNEQYYSIIYKIDSDTDQMPIYMIGS